MCVDQSVYLPELRLFLEELCCELCRFRHMKDDRLAPEDINVDREWSLGPPGAFADIYVTLCARGIWTDPRLF